MPFYSQNAKILLLTPYLLSKDQPTLPKVGLKKEPLFFTAVKRRVFCYRLVFLALGIFFIYLAGILLFQVPGWNFKQLFGHDFVFKTILGAITSCFGIAALWIGCSLRTSYEALHRIAADSKRTLKKAQLLDSRNKKGIHLAMQEIEALKRDAFTEIEEIDGHFHYKDVQKKVLTIEVILALQARLKAITDTF